MRVFTIILKEDDIGKVHRAILRVDGDEKAIQHTATHPTLLQRLMDVLENDLGQDIFGVGGITSEGPF